jgi:threonine dehydratase
MGRRESSSFLTVEDVRVAADAIAGAVTRTPSAVSATLSDLLGCTVVVKFENLQFVASFKERGARNKLLHLSDEQRDVGVVAISAGNHAQAVARHAQLLGIRATIVMPDTTPYTKVARTRALGGGSVDIVLHGERVADAMAYGNDLVAREGRTLVHPFDDPLVIAGQGTVALELLADHPELDAIVAPVGGGGLMAGIAVVARAIKPDIDLVGVQTEAYPSMAYELAGRSDAVAGTPTIAEGIAVSHAGVLTSAILREHDVDVVLVSERAIEEAINLFGDIEKVVSEGAGAAGLAALIDHRDRFAGKRVGVVLSGGNIDPRLLAAVIMRGLVHSGRLWRFVVQLDDRPGALARLSKVVGDVGGNIVEVHHQRLFQAGPARTTDVELAVETMDRGHGDRLVAAIREAGYDVIVVPL